MSLSKPDRSLQFSMRANRVATLDFGRTQPVQIPSLTSVSRHESELQEALERRRRVGPAFTRMLESLTRIVHGNPSKTGLLNLAQRISRNKGVPVDRAAKRSKDCLICWFCEFVPELIMEPVSHPIKMESITALIPASAWNGIGGFPDQMAGHQKHGREESNSEEPKTE